MEHKRVFRAAQGYLELGMFDDALAELGELPEEERDGELATCFRLDVLNGAKRWADAAEVAREGVERHGGCLHLYIMGAYAVRRAEESVAAALEFLTAGQGCLDKDKPEFALYLFNVGCYHAQLGNVNDAMDSVTMAVECDEAYKEMAMSDPDLEPVRDELRSELG